MKNVLVFFNAEPVRVQKVVNDVTSVMRLYPSGEEAYLKIMLAGVHSLTGDHREFCVASDRELTSEEIIAAANRLL